MKKIRLLFIREVAREINVWPQTIYRLIARGRLAATKHASGKLVVASADIEKIKTMTRYGRPPTNTSFEVGSVKLVKPFGRKIACECGQTFWIGPNGKSIVQCPMCLRRKRRSEWLTRQ